MPHKRIVALGAMTLIALPALSLIGGCRYYEDYHSRMVANRLRNRETSEIRANYNPGDWEHERQLALPFQLPGTELELVRLRNGISVSPEGIRVSAPNRGFILTSLDQLHGLVQIKDANEVLQFVRLRTLADYDLCWDNDFYEVVNLADIPENSAEQATPGKPRKWENSGVYAQLSPTAYRLGGFQRPVIENTPEGYRITRWVCAFHNLEGQELQKWRETVSRDGTYRLEVQEKRPLPKLPDTQWYVMGRM